MKSTTPFSLAEEYGALVKNVDNQYYRYLVPLTTVETNGAISAFNGMAPRSSALTADSAPPKRPIGVRM